MTQDVYEAPPERPGDARRNDTRGRRLGIGILVLFGLCVVLAVFTILFDDETDILEREREQLVQADDQPLAEGVDPAGVLGVGEDFVLGDLRYTVSTVRQAQHVGDDIFTASADEGNVFVIIEVAIVNEGDENRTVITDGIRLGDMYDGERLRPSPQANVALSMAAHAELVVARLDPGETTEMMTVFEVSEEVVNRDFYIIVPEHRATGNDEASILIQPDDIQRTTGIVGS